MKTKIRTLIAFFALGMIGFININAITDNKKAANTEVGTGNAEMLTIESWLTNEAFLYSAKAFTAIDINEEIEKYKEEMLANESWLTNESFSYSAKAFTTVDIDEEIEKYATMQILPDENVIAKSDFQTSAEEFLTASGANQEIEKYANKQVSLQLTRIGK